VASLIKSRQRVIDHGEVFTPPEIVDAMLDLVKTESERIDSRFLEPACGSGNFLIAVLRRKLAVVESRYGKNEFERRHYALLALMSLYGIEILEDNVAECQQNLLEEWTSFVDDSQWAAAARAVLEANIVWADALTMKTCTGPKQYIVFAEWSYLGKGRYQRRDFRYDTLTQMSSFGEDTLFGSEKHDVFQPVREYPPMTYLEVANG
jgi:hypothetical protein